MDFNVGDIVEGKITGISKFGAFVEFAEGKVGLVHISEVSSHYVSDINEIYSVGDEVKVKIISMEKNKISLSIKQLQADAPQKKEFREKKKFAPKPKYSSPGRPGDAVWEAAPVDKDMSFEDKLNLFKMASDEKLGDLKKKNGNDGKRRSKKGMSPIC